VFDKVVDGIAKQAEKIQVKQGFDPDSDMGPLVSEEQLNRVCGYLESGIKEGAEPLVGGARLGDKGYFVKPTVLVNTNQKMKVEREEIFGPVVAAIPFRIRTRSCPERMTPSTVWLREFGPKTSRKHTRLPRNCAREPSGSTATTSSTQLCRSGDTNSPAGVAKWATKYWSSIRK
jgi:hypothetical protein